MPHVVRPLVLSLALAGAVASPAAAGSPSFAPYASYPTGSGSGPGPAPVSTVCLDADSDGRIDIATVSDFGQGEVLLVPGAGDGTFGAARAIPGTSGVQSLASGDLDADGDPDLVGMTADSVLVVRNDGGSFVPAQRLPVRLGAQVQAIVADGDGDGDLDVVAPTFEAIQTLRNDGSGAFTPGPRTTVPGATSLAAVTAATLDGDGVTDLLTVDGGSGVVHALRGSSSLAFVVGGRLAGAGFGLEDVAAIDLDGDGIDDAAAVGSFSFTLGTGLSDGRGGFRSPVATLQPGGSGPTSAAVGDLDRDGREDLLVSTLFSPQGTLRAYSGNGTVRPTAAGSFTVGAFPQNPVLADLDGDGRLDAVTAGPGELSVLRNTTP